MKASGAQSATVQPGGVVLRDLSNVGIPAEWAANPAGYLKMYAAGLNRLMMGQR